MVAVEGCILKATNDTGGAAQVQITTPPSPGVKAGPIGAPLPVYRGPLQISVTNFEGATITQGAGTGVLQPNVTGTRVDGMYPFQEGAQAEVTCTGPLKSGTGSGTEVAMVQLIDSGQTSVKFE